MVCRKGTPYLFDINFSLNAFDKTVMKDEFIDALVELSNFLAKENEVGSSRQAAAIVEQIMGLLEEEGVPITRESLLRNFNSALEMIRDLEQRRKEK